MSYHFIYDGDEEEQKMDNHEKPYEAQSFLEKTYILKSKDIPLIVFELHRVDEKLENIKNSYYRIENTIEFFGTMFQASQKMTGLNCVICCTDFCIDGYAIILICFVGQPVYII